MRIGLAIAIAAVPALSALLALPALAQGSRITALCKAVLSCGMSGNCTTDETIYDFVFQPRDVGPDGTGSYDVTYRGQTVSAQGTRDFAFNWSHSDGDWTNFLLTSDTSALLVLRRLGTPGLTTVRNLTCEVLQ